MSLANGLSIYLLKEPVLLIFAVVFFVSFSFISALIFMISFLLLTVGFFISSFSSCVRCAAAAAAVAKSLQSCPTVQPHRLQPMLGVKLGYLFDFSLGH